MSPLKRLKIALTASVSPALHLSRKIWLETVFGNSTSSRFEGGGLFQETPPAELISVVISIVTFL